MRTIILAIAITLFCTTLCTAQNTPESSGPRIDNDSTMNALFESGFKALGYDADETARQMAIVRTQAPLQSFDPLIRSVLAAGGWLAGLRFEPAATAIHLPVELVSQGYEAIYFIHGDLGGKVFATAILNRSLPRGYAIDFVNRSGTLFCPGESMRMYSVRDDRDDETYMAHEVLADVDVTEGMYLQIVREH